MAGGNSYSSSQRLQALSTLHAMLVHRRLAERLDGSRTPPSFTPLPGKWQMAPFCHHHPPLLQTLLNDCKDLDPTIRGLAVRSMCGLRVPDLMESVVR